MTERLRGLVERFLPWFDQDHEHARDKRTEAIRRYSIAARKRSERLIEEYREASDDQADAGERLIDELERDDR